MGNNRGTSLIELLVIALILSVFMILVGRPLHRSVMANDAVTALALAKDEGLIDPKVIYQSQLAVFSSCNLLDRSFFIVEGVDQKNERAIRYVCRSIFKKNTIRTTQ